MKGLIRAILVAGLLAGGMASAQELGADDSPQETTAQSADPNVGAVTHLPLPRYVTLKTREGNARRGPSLTHRIDWVFARDGMPLKITAEYGHWRRVEDSEGMGGWMHYALLSGTRSVMITADIADLHTSPSDDAAIVVRAEKDVIARLMQCTPNWCRVRIGDQNGWVSKTEIWGVDPGETVE
ncbi:SH3 domain-containing protein [Falsirhodobacter sp. alg1]|uniref:SH3 domain-containing protein n=1 Tax=Falsirhodobacter sp. alg1 TaxID=1472418 RepID=UPI000B17112F|nr:SH3 domain-containing protein [Falsirhodobacter sp. alg1]